MKPYALLADIHLHPWSAFSTITERGMNSRLAGLLSEIVRASLVLKQTTGSKRIVIAGDLFHVRGKIAPSVLNPTAAIFKELVKDGYEVIIMPGNHDLEGKETTELNSAVTVLGGLGCKIVHETGTTTDGLTMIPWIEDLATLRQKFVGLQSSRPFNNIDLILHAPINGVIPGLPESGLTPEELAKLGFGRVFAGHYHNHKAFAGYVWSIGALAHHTWSDVGSKAGFLIVTENEVRWNKSHLPEFVEMDDGESEDDFALRIPGNFVRMKVRSTKNTILEEARAWAMDNGAAGVTVIPVKDAVVERREGGITVNASATLEASVADFVRSRFKENVGEIQTMAQTCLAEATVAG